MKEKCATFCHLSVLSSACSYITGQYTAKTKHQHAVCSWIHLIKHLKLYLKSYCSSKVTDTVSRSLRGRCKGVKQVIGGSLFTLFPKWGEKRVFDGLLQGDALRHIILHHLLEQVKQLLMFRALGGHVLLEE